MDASAWSSEDSSASSLSWDWEAVPQLPALVPVVLRPRAFHLGLLLRRLQSPPSIFTYVLTATLQGVLVSLAEGSRVLIFLRERDWYCFSACDRGSAPSWDVVQPSEPSISGGVWDPKPFGEFAREEELFDYEPSLVDEADWYNAVREDRPPSPVHEVGAFPEKPLSFEHLGEPSVCAAEVAEPASSSKMRARLSDEAFVKLAAEMSFKKLRAEGPKQAWQDHPVFGGDPFTASLTSWLAMTPSVGIRETVNPPDPDVELRSDDFQEIPWTVQRRLQRIRIVRSDEDERNHALKKLKVMVLLDPMATNLGRHLMLKTGELEDEDLVAASFCDAFAQKAAGTLTKRAGSLHRLVVQLFKQGVGSPWRMEESDLYSALSAMRDSGCGASAPSHVLEALHFMHAVVHFRCMDLKVVISARCKGLAHSSFLGKQPLVQRDSLKCKQAMTLEHIMVRAGEVERCVLGHVLFCLHAVCRWKDSQRLKAVHLLGDGESQLIFAEALGSKTSHSKEAKTRFTPYAALAQGLTECGWGKLWLDARASCGLTFGEGADGFALPTWSLRLDTWGSTEMGSAEATAWIQDWLADTGVENQRIGTHSLKTTLLTWAGRSTIIKLTDDERLLLGHHVLPKVKSMVTYSREAYTSLAGKVLALYRTIRSGAFDPDLDPASRVMQVADALEKGVQSASTEGGRRQVSGLEPPVELEADSDGSASEPEEPEPFDVPGPKLVRAPFANVDLAKCRIHMTSGIAHCLREDGVFLCGRLCTERYSSYEGVGAEDPDVCLQCSRAMGE
ncbi:unnamed protein product [Symbiodinium natans]|uniref:Uncharacterized protein n=1 Tax=Symbiodinium natans TaxID=878477 RepID=A0A812I3R5_9DINO|nr:unnamed protein product [Symbiodinium natans]